MFYLLYVFWNVTMMIWLVETIVITKTSVLYECDTLMKLIMNSQTYPNKFDKGKSSPSIWLLNIDLG